MFLEDLTIRNARYSESQEKKVHHQKCPKLARPRDFDKAHQARSRAWTRLARPFQGLSQPWTSSPEFPNPCLASQDRPHGPQKSSASKSSFVASSTPTTTTHFNVEFTFLPYTSTLFWSQPTLLAGDVGAPRTKWAAGSAIDSAARRHKVLLSFDVPSSPSSRSIEANCVRQLSTPARPRSAHAQRPTATDLRAVAGAGLLLHRPSLPSRNRRQAISPSFLEAKPQTRARDSFGEGDASIAQAGARPIPRGVRALNFRRRAGSDRGRLMTRSSLGSSSGALSRRDPRLSPALRRSIDNILVKRSFPTATASIGAKEWRSEMLPTSSNDVSCRVTLVAPRTPSLPQLRRILSPSEISNSNLKIVLQVNIYVFASPSRVFRTWTQFYQLLVAQPPSSCTLSSSLFLYSRYLVIKLFFSSLFGMTGIGKEGLERPCKGPKAFRGRSRASKGTQARDALAWPCEFEECLGRGAQALDVLVRPWDPSKGLPRPLEGLSAFGDVGERSKVMVLIG
ncbi:hypothetical protein FB451DRAFT_1441948 [Mycena latifolia]|nr:hypothetical protein FB451DRAFT_1441948 [Mycena latifolia]